MKTTIEVKDRKEADLIKIGLAHPMTRAFVVAMGALLQLPTDRARARVLNFVADHFTEQKDQQP